MGKTARTEDLGLVTKTRKGERDSKRWFDESNQIMNGLQAEE